MIYKDFSMTAHGFVGHMAEPENKTDTAVIVIMGGEKSILPGKNVAEHFAQLGFAAVSVSLFGAEGLPKGIDGIPLDMFEKVISYLRNECGNDSKIRKNSKISELNDKRRKNETAKTNT
ncbi:MAG: hypothetical protein ACI4KF_10230 [Huintestinicola sp.]